MAPDADADADVFVFLGPSLPVEEARRELTGAVFLPPVRRGDVYRVVSTSRPSVIGIVDGFFDGVPAVVHKEILFALSKGVRVLGAASMGALRAAELGRFGMEGVGRIFERYEAGAWDADDEVAVAHGPEEAAFRPASVALANIRLGLESAEARGVVSRASVATLASCAQAQFYVERSWESLYELGEAGGVPAAELAALRAFVDEERPNAKRDDAVELLRRIRALLDAGVSHERPEIDFDFEPTTYWERLVTETRAIGRDAPDGTTAFTHDDLFRHLRTQPDGPEQIRGAALLHFLTLESRRRDLAGGEERVVAACDRFRHRHGLISVAETRDWLSAQQMTWSDLVELMRLEVTLQTVLKEASGPIRGLLPAELRRRAEFDAVARVIGGKMDALREAGVDSLTLDDADVSFADLIAWYEERCEPVHGTLEDHAGDLGFDSSRELLSELLLDYRVVGGVGREAAGLGDGE